MRATRALLVDGDGNGDGFRNQESRARARDGGFLHTDCGVSWTRTTELVVSSKRAIVQDPKTPSSQ